MLIKQHGVKVDGLNPDATAIADRVHDQRHDLLHVVAALRLHHPVAVVPRLVDLAVSPLPSPAPAVLSTVRGPLLCSNHHVLNDLIPIE